MAKETEECWFSNFSGYEFDDEAPTCPGSWGGPVAGNGTRIATGGKWANPAPGRIAEFPCFPSHPPSKQAARRPPFPGTPPGSGGAHHPATELRVAGTGLSKPEAGIRPMERRRAKGAVWREARTGWEADLKGLPGGFPDCEACARRVCSSRSPGRRWSGPYPFGSAGTGRQKPAAFPRAFSESPYFGVAVSWVPA